jgi:hypothetical protein
MFVLRKMSRWALACELLMFFLLIGDKAYLLYFRPTFTSFLLFSSYISLFRPFPYFRPTFPYFRLTVPYLRSAFLYFRPTFPSFLLFSFYISLFRPTFPYFLLAFPYFRPTFPYFLPAFLYFRPTFPYFLPTFPHFRPTFPCSCDDKAESLKLSVSRWDFRFLRRRVWNNPVGIDGHFRGA